MMGKSDYAALDGEWYLVYRKGRFFQLFNEDRDPKHQSDIARRHRTVVRKMAEKHMAFFRYAFHLQRRRIGDADIHLGKAESLEKRGAPKKEILFHLRKYFLLAKDDPGLADERAWVAKWVERLQSGHQDE
jgi:hypothetical protein